MRFSLFFRLFVALGGCTTGAIGIAIVVQDHSLSRDLAASAQERVEVSVRAAESLIESHIEAVAERYRVVARSPQLRATLELGDSPTLAHFADTLLEREGALRITFLNPIGAVTAEVGETTVPLSELKERGLVPGRKTPCVSVITPLTTGDREIGKLIALEPISPQHLEEWSSLVGADVRFGTPKQSRESLSIPLERYPSVPMVVESTLRREIEAQDHARWNLMGAGLLGLTCALIASWFLSRGFVKPIVAIREATREMGWGDLAIRLEIDRNDEIGDVATSVNRMAERLQQSADVIHHANDTLLETNSLLAQSRDRVEAESRQKSQLIVEQSPEILEALQGITATVRALNRTDLSAETQPLAKAAQNSTQLLSRRLGGWIDLARLDLGVTVEPEAEFSPGEVLREVIEEFSSIGRLRRVRLFASVDSDVPDRVRGCPTFLSRILSQIIEHRLDLPAGESLFVEVGVGKRLEVETQLVWRVRTTVAIEESERESLAHALTMGDDADEPDANDNAWGWTLCRRLGEYLGGTFDVRTGDDHGTAIEFRLASEATVGPSKSILQLLRSVDFESLRILVVDPYEPGAHWLRQQIAVWGATCEIASFDDAIAVLRAAALEQDPYHAVLVHGGVGVEAVRGLLQTITETRVMESTKVIGVEGCGEFAELEELHALLSDPPPREAILEAIAAARGEPVERDLRRSLPERSRRQTDGA